MEAKELRINNYYLSTKFNCSVKCSIEDFYNLCADCQGAELDSDIIGYVFKPIPLTEEWLLKFGFEYTKKYKGYILGNMIVFKVHKHAMSDDWFYEIEYSAHGGIEERTNIIKRYDYVHQLQNLFFALTGTELDLQK
jgi:hypothetical protein